MKIPALGFAAGLALAFASVVSALAQSPPPAYYETVASPNCVGTNNCTFIFPPVPTGATGGSFQNAPAYQRLTVMNVNCRIVTVAPASNSSLLYAALGKTSNADKIAFLSSTVGSYIFHTGLTTVYTIFQIDQKTQFFVGAGFSPTITIVAGPPSGLSPLPGAIIAPTSLDEPTCSVSGLIE
jgi:hypothetical protein